METSKSWRVSDRNLLAQLSKSSFPDWTGLAGEGEGRPAGRLWDDEIRVLFSRSMCGVRSRIV